MDLGYSISLGYRSSIDLYNRFCDVGNWVHGMASTAVTGQRRLEHRSQGTLGKPMQNLGDLLRLRLIMSGQ